jgi:hypothetical protein
VFLANIKKVRVGRRYGLSQGEEFAAGVYPQEQKAVGARFQKCAHIVYQCVALGRGQKQFMGRLLATGCVTAYQLQGCAQAARVRYVVASKMQIAVGHAPIVGASVVSAGSGKLAGWIKGTVGGRAPVRLCSAMMKIILDDFLNTVALQTIGSIKR